MQQVGKGNSKRWVLNDRDIMVMERIYTEEWDETGIAGGCETWFRVVQRFLGWAGYEIRKVGSPEAGE